MGTTAQVSLKFDASAGHRETIELHDGTAVAYTAYEQLYYVTNVEDSTYQFLNVYVPDGATQQTPIFLRTYVGGYMASPAAQPQAGDATGRALKEGYVVVIPGTRGRNATITADRTYAKKHKGVKKGQTIYTGRAPKAILDLKAAVRYLRHFDKEMLGDAEHIVTDGTSAGGAMSALLGATGNRPEYAELLKEMGAADERDDVFAAVCYCPIIDLEHADMAYEWLFRQTDSRQALDETHKAYTAELADMFPAYINSLNLRKPDGTPLTAENYMDYIKSEIIRSAQIAKNAGADIPENIGFSFSNSAGGMFAAPVNGGANGVMKPMLPAGGRPPIGYKVKRPKRGNATGGRQVGEYITELDMQKYLNYVVSTQALKGVPAFDSWIENVNEGSGENEEFGDATGSSINFTDFTAQKNHTVVTDAVRQNVRLMNPMSFIGDAATTVAPHWYIRHGARDRDTAFPIPVNLATKLQNAGKNVNFLLAWNRPHSGDYALDELFNWLQSICPTTTATATETSIYDFQVVNDDGENVRLSKYKGKVLLIVNTATKCGFTPQYKDLQALYTQYRQQGLEILDFPCNQFGQQAPGSIKEIHQFCTANFDIEFPQFDKIDVNGEHEAPLYTYLKSQKGFGGFNLNDRLGKLLDEMMRKQDADYNKKASIKWNFTKFLVNREGQVIKRYEPTEPMENISKDIADLLNM